MALVSFQYGPIGFIFSFIVKGLTGSGVWVFGAPLRQTAADMAEYTQAGLLAALVLFTALTVRDVYLGRSSLHRAGSPGSSPEPLPDTGPGKPAKPSLYTGPVLRFQYW